MFSKKKLKEVGFPDNLIFVLLGVKELDGNITYRGLELIYETPPESEVAKVLETLTEREEEVIYKRYKECKTLEEIANDYSVTSERISQIEAKALRKLKHPMRLDNLVYAKVLCREIYDLKNTVSYYERLLPEHIVAPFLLEDLNLSVRPYNCLRRKGIRFVIEILDIDLRKVRNLGRKSLLEIIDKMIRVGYRKELILAGYLDEIAYLEDRDNFLKKLEEN